MAFVHGFNSSFSLDGTLFDAYTDQASLDRAVDLAEKTTFGSSGKKVYISGLEGATMTASGHWDATADGVINGLYDAASVAIIYGPAGTTAGNVKYTFDAFVTGSNVTSNVGDNVTWNVNLTMTGALTVTTY